MTTKNKDIDYRKVFNEYKKKAQELLKDDGKVEKLIHDSEEKLATLPKVGKALKYIPVFVDMLRCYFTGEYKEIPTGTIIAISASLLYFVSPIDIIPDFIPLLGLADDAGVAAVALVFVKSDLDIFMNWRKHKPIDVVVKRKAAKAKKAIATKAKSTTKKVAKKAVKAKVKKDVNKAKTKAKNKAKAVKKKIESK